MDRTPNRIQEQLGSVTDRKPTDPEAKGPLIEEVNAATKSPEKAPLMPAERETDHGYRRREAIWSELHSPEEAGLPEVDPRAIGDATGNKRGEE
jgi:hypothetical protein